MKNLKYLLFLFILPAFFACEDDQTYDGPPRVKFEKTADRVTIPMTDLTEKVNVQLVSSPLGHPIDVTVTITGGTAVRGTHYDVTLPEKLTIAAGQNIVSFDVQLYYSAFEFMETRTIEFELQGSSAATDIPGVNKFVLTAIPEATLTYTNVGVGSYNSDLFGGPYPVEFERCDQLPNVYVMLDFFANPIAIQIDPEAGTAVIEAQDLGQIIFSNASTNTWLQCTKGRYAAGVVTFEGDDSWSNVFWASEALSGGGLEIGVDIYTLPEGSY